MQTCHNAVALNSTSFNAARMIGPAVAGLVIAAVGTGWAFLINGASFFAVLISLACLRALELRPMQRPGTSTKGSFTEGLRYVWGRPDLRAILVMLFLIGTFGLNFPIFISTMAVGVFHADARGIGLLSSIMAIGTMSGALLARGRERPRSRSLLIGAASSGSAARWPPWRRAIGCSPAALVVIGVAALTFTNTTNSLMQLSTEPAMRGRVMALRSASHLAARRSAHRSSAGWPTISGRAGRSASARPPASPPQSSRSARSLDREPNGTGITRNERVRSAAAALMANILPILNIRSRFAREATGDRQRLLLVIAE